MNQAHPPLRRSSMRPVPWRINASGTTDRGAPVRNATDVRPFMLRRLLLLGLVLLGAWVGTHAMATVLPNKGAAPAEIALLALFGILFGWISAGFWTGVFGALVLMHGNREGPLERGAGNALLLPLDPGARTAIVMPICNEDVATVFGGLTATIDSLRATGEASNFDVFVLSDTGDPAIRAAEHAAFCDLAARYADGDDKPALQVHYRWRQIRVKRKAGNVADFCRRWGAAYRYFVVLDADSVMTGECLTSLVRLMEANPDAGIIQTAPAAAGHDTLHARVQQFCARAYGPLFTAGMRFWQCGESHYWGHNAILRMAPVHRALRLGADRRKAFSCGRNPLARLRRGGADAARRLEGLGCRPPGRQLRAGAAQPAGRAATRPPLVPGQPAKLATDVRARAAHRAPGRFPRPARSPTRRRRSGWPSCCCRRTCSRSRPVPSPPTSSSPISSSPPGRRSTSSCCSHCSG